MLKVVLDKSCENFDLNSKPRAVCLLCLNIQLELSMDHRHRHKHTTIQSINTFTVALGLSYK